MIEEMIALLQIEADALGIVCDIREMPNPFLSHTAPWDIRIKFPNSHNICCQSERMENSDIRLFWKNIQTR